LKHSFSFFRFLLYIQLSSVRIGRDNKGVKPGWLVDKITIDVDEKDEHYVFYCNRWLGSSDTAVEFTPGNSLNCIEHA
jgi:hypothetical protein